MKPLSLLQLNVGRGGDTHEIALSLAHSANIDIILIQEPYVYQQDLSRRITKCHPLYECFSPTDDWVANGWPRVLTYTQKSIGIRSTQLRPTIADPTILSDLLFLQILSPSGGTLLVMNVYNAPPGSIRAGEAAKALSLLPSSFFHQPLFMAGDFNLLHSRWQPSLQGSHSILADPFVDWLDNSQLVLISEIDCPTHNRDNVLDLAFTSSPLVVAGASSEVAYHLNTTSDHLPLLSSIPWDQRFAKSARNLRPTTLDQPLFLSLLAANLDGPEPLASTTDGLNSLANKLTLAIHKAYEGAAKRSLEHQSG